MVDDPLGIIEFCRGFDGVYRGFVGGYKGYFLNRLVGGQTFL